MLNLKFIGCVDSSLSSLLVTKYCAPWAGCQDSFWFIVSAEPCLPFPLRAGVPEAFFCSELLRAHYTTLFQKAQLLKKQMHWAGEALSNWMFDNEVLVPLPQKISSPGAEQKHSSLGSDSP